ncbi:MAG: hypothetical protein WAM60_13120 [Candidatus Promineifilaceae bacterium]
MANPIGTTEQPAEMLDTGKARPWPVRVLTILLVVQAVGLFGLSVLNYNPTILQQENDLLGLLLTIFSELTRTIAFGALGLLAVVAALGFLWLWRTGWPLTMLLQGLCLLTSLGLYLRGGPPYIFAIMSYCILMVIYLHHPEIQQAFHTKQRQDTKMEDAA